MKIVFTGGGTGGHFYPIIAVAQKVNQLIDRENIIGAKLYFLSDSPYDNEMLFQNSLRFEKISTGKMRTYFSIHNFLDIFKTILGVVNAIYKLFTIYPDVVFGKGGYASFPTILAARILGIPVFIHESDRAPGRVNLWAGRFAKKVAVSFKEAAQFFPKDVVAWTGQPVRIEIENASSRSEALKYFKFESNMPILLILGGSQGAEIINNTILDALPRLLKKYQVIHQTGVSNFKNVTARADVVLTDNPDRIHYKPLAFLNSLDLKMGAGAASLIISRAGSTLFEIAFWGVPSILIPFTESNGDHAKKNAFTYAHAGGCSVVEENNMTANILGAEVERILENKEEWAKMSQSAKAFGHKDAATKIARALVDMAIIHEQ